SSPQGAEEEDAAGGYFPRDEAPRALRKALREEGPRKGGSRAPRAQAGPQEVAARRPAADEAEAGVRRGSRRRRARRSRWRPRRCGRRTPSALSQVQISRYENAGPGPAFFVAASRFAMGEIIAESPSGTPTWRPAACLRRHWCAACRCADRPAP